MRAAHAAPRLAHLLLLLAILTVAACSVIAAPTATNGSGFRLLSEGSGNSTGNCTCPEPNVTDPCAAASQDEEYDLPLHIGAVFIMFGVACCRIPPVILLLGRAFGTGVILATAFVHMLPPAMQALTDPCLGSTFSEDYTAFAGAFAMIAVLLVQMIEFVSTDVIEKRFIKEIKSSALMTPLASAETTPSTAAKEDTELPQVKSTTPLDVDIDVKTDSLPVPVPVEVGEIVAPAHHGGHAGLHHHDDTGDEHHHHAGVLTGKVPFSLLPYLSMFVLCCLVLVLSLPVLRLPNLMSPLRC
jgi:hypothetical protein